MKIFTATFLLVLISFLAPAQDLQLGQGFFEGEPNLAIDPTNTKNIVVAWMHITPAMRSIRTRASFDEGQTWSANFDIQHLYIKYADPTMAFDNNGNLYLGFINHSDGPPEVGGVYSIKSTDGGLSWGGIQEVINIDDDPSHQPIDRPWLVCDRSGGPYDGNLYLTSKPVIGTPSPFRPYFIRSTNGAVSWVQWRYLDTTNWLSGMPTAMALPSVDANGNFHGIYASYVPAQSPLPRYLMVSSNNGGASFTYDEVISFVPTAASNDSAKLSWEMIANPADADHLALFFVQGQSGDLDILMTETTNGGNTWSNVIRVNDDQAGNGVMQDLVWASFDDDGDLVVCWRDRRNGAGPFYKEPTEIFGAVKWKDSIQFSANFTISDQQAAYQNILAEAGNDFLSQQVVDDTLYIAWGDTRTGFLNIWFDRIDIKTGNTVGITSLAKTEIPFLEIFPNPATDVVEVNIKQEELIEIYVVNEQGKLIYQTKQKTFSIQNWSAGIYFIKVRTINGEKVLKLHIK